MANITKEINVPSPCTIDSPIYDHLPHGWYAVNSVIIGDCVPEYRNAGGGVCAEYLTDLPTALQKSINNLDVRIYEAERLKKRLVEVLNKCA